MRDVGKLERFRAIIALPTTYCSYFSTTYYSYTSILIAPPLAVPFTVLTNLLPWLRTVFLFRDGTHNLGGPPDPARSPRSR